MLEDIVLMIIPINLIVLVLVTLVQKPHSTLRTLNHVFEYSISCFRFDLV